VRKAVLRLSSAFFPTVGIISPSQQHQPGEPGHREDELLMSACRPTLLSFGSFMAGASSPARHIGDSEQAKEGGGSGRKWAEQLVAG
jgi:hypothetical protein